MGTWKLWRRGLIGGAASAAAAGLAGGGFAPMRLASAQGAASPTAAPAARKGLECIVLGTKGGPRVGPG